MKYIKYILYAIAIDVLIYLVVLIFLSAGYAKSIAIIVVPLALWSARLIVAFQTGVITRRMQMLDGGSTSKGIFWSFNPEVYIRKPGFDNFKGYMFKETLCCLLIWLLFLSPVIMTILSDLGIKV